MPRARKLKLFSNMAPQSFFELSWLALQKARAREVGATRMTGRKFLSPPSYGSLCNPITEVPRARKLKLFFQNGPLQSFFEFNSTGRPAKKHVRRPQISQPPPLMAETEAVFQYGPLQSDCGSGKLTPRCSTGAGGCAESILDQGNPKPGKG